MTAKCLSCELLNELHTISSTLSSKIFIQLAPYGLMLFGVGLTIYCLAQIIFGMLEDTLADRMKKLVPVLIWSSLVVALLAVQPNEKPAAYSWLIEPIEQASLGVGLELLEIAEVPIDAPKELTTVRIFGEEQTNRYAQLGFAVERSVFYLMNLSWTLVGGGISSTIAGVLLLIPYGLLLIYFTFLLLTASFSFLAAGASLPIAVLGIPFPRFRGMWQACWSLAKLGGFTTFFICLAMAFSVTAIEQVGRKISTIQNLTEYFEPRLDEQLSLIEKHCDRMILKSKKSGLERRINEHFDLQICQTARGEYEGLKVQFDQASPLEPGNSAYFILLIMGGVSLLLHYQASKFAANFSGAQDSGGAAFAFAAGTKALGIGAILSANPQALSSMLKNGISSAKGAEPGSGVKSFMEGMMSGEQASQDFGRMSPLDIAKGYKPSDDK